MLVRVLVVDQQLPFLTVPPRLVAGDLHQGEVGAAFAEDGVHLFEGAVGGFGVEEVDDGEYEGIAVVKEKRSALGFTSGSKTM